MSVSIRYRVWPVPASSAMMIDWSTSPLTRSRISPAGRSSATQTAAAAFRSYPPANTDDRAQNLCSESVHSW